jgi:hypothetical protein
MKFTKKGTLSLPVTDSPRVELAQWSRWYSASLCMDTECPGLGLKAQQPQRKDSVIYSSAGKSWN